MELNGRALSRLMDVADRMQKLFLKSAVAFAMMERDGEARHSPLGHSHFGAFDSGNAARHVQSFQRRLQVFVVQRNMAAELGDVTERAAGDGGEFRKRI